VVRSCQLVRWINSLRKKYQKSYHKYTHFRFYGKIGYTGQIFSYNISLCDSYILMFFQLKFIVLGSSYFHISLSSSRGNRVFSRFFLCHENIDWLCFTKETNEKMLRCVTLEVEYDIYKNGILFSMQTCLQVVPLNIPCLEHFDT
jgi:hypothetical protein